MKNGTVSPIRFWTVFTVDLLGWRPLEVITYSLVSNIGGKDGTTRLGFPVPVIDRRPYTSEFSSAALIADVVIGVAATWRIEKSTKQSR